MRRATAPLPAPPPSGTATRVPLRRWRDPRLVLGLLIVSGSVVLGTWVVAAADDTVTVWGVRAALPAGLPIGADTLEPRRVRFADGAADRYLPTSSAVVGRRLARSVGAGELLPAAALAGTADPAGLQVPLTVEDSGLPGSVRAGAVVDVWVTPRDPATGGTRARRVLDDVVVLEGPGSPDRLAPTSTSTVVVAVADDADLGDVLGATAGGRVVLTVRSVR